MSRQACPLCDAEVMPSGRYPRRVCPACASRARAADGRLLAFSNLDASGGFMARYADTDEPHAGHECFIDGVKCWADEARFGGIVVEATGHPPPASA